MYVQDSLKKKIHAYSIDQIINIALAKIDHNIYYIISIGVT